MTDLAAELRSKAARWRGEAQALRELAANLEIEAASLDQTAEDLDDGKVRFVQQPDPAEGHDSFACAVFHGPLGEPLTG
jgi:hypothetical protein